MSVLIKDDIISPAYQDLVATAVDNYEAPWYIGGDQDEYQGWATHYLRDDQILNNNYFLLVPILLEAVHKTLDSKEARLSECEEDCFVAIKMKVNIRNMLILNILITRCFTIPSIVME